MNKVRVSIIAAIDEKNGLGKNNDLLFKIPSDLKHFREKTKNHPIIMGRKTFESLHRPEGLPDRENIVITKEKTYKVLNPDSVFPYQSLDAALSQARHIAQQKNLDEVFIIGGGQIFKQAIEEGLVDRLYLTVVKGEYEADTFFPDYSMFKTALKKEDHEEGGYKYTFLDLER